MESNVIIHELVLKEIIKHANMNPSLECGGYLYGNVDVKNNVANVYINCMYYEPNRIGKEAGFNFSPLYDVSAINYSKQHNLPLIGTYHSHGKYDTTFSPTDIIELEGRWNNNNVTMIYSPGYNDVGMDFCTPTTRVTSKVLVRTNNDEQIDIKEYLNNLNNKKSL